MSSSIRLNKLCKRYGEHVLKTCLDLCVTPEQLARVERDVTTQEVPAGAIIERKGELAQVWIGVIAGLVKISVGNAEGKLASLTGVPAGGWIGEGSLLKRERRRTRFGQQRSHLHPVALPGLAGPAERGLPVCEGLQPRGRGQGDAFASSDHRDSETYNDEKYVVMEVCWELHGEAVSPLF